MNAKVYTHRGIKACMLKGSVFRLPASQEQKVQMIAQFLLMNAPISSPNCEETFNSKHSGHSKCAAGLGHSNMTGRGNSSLQMQHVALGTEAEHNGGSGTTETVH